MRSVWRLRVLIHGLGNIPIHTSQLVPHYLLEGHKTPSSNLSDQPNNINTHNTYTAPINLKSTNIYPQMGNKSPQYTTNTSPSQHKPTQRLTHNTTAKPNIPPSPLPQNPPRTSLPTKLHVHPLSLLIHLNDALNLAGIATREERARAAAVRAADENQVEES